MDVYKDFIQRITKLTYNDTYLLLFDNILPKLKHYVLLLDNVKLIDGSYHIYYGEVKKIITSFIDYYCKAIDDIITDADNCSHVLDKEELLFITERTINIYQINQVEFGREFLPVKSPSERTIYEEVEAKYLEHMDKLLELRETFEGFKKQDKVDEFTKDHFKISLKRMSEIFRFTHNYLATMLANNVDNVNKSLEEILLRMKNNLARIREENAKHVSNLLNELYDKNKEHLFIVCRDDRRSSVEDAEVNRSLEIIKDKITNTEDIQVTIDRLQTEVDYWNERLQELHKIMKLIKTLKTEQENVNKQVEKFGTMKPILHHSVALAKKLLSTAYSFTFEMYCVGRTTELPGQKYRCWQNMGAAFRRRLDFIDQALPEAARTLITFFSPAGVNRMIYRDEVGEFFKDDYFHQVYRLDYGLGLYHVDCDGNFVENKDEDKYYFDLHGRYFLRDGEKVYQAAHCTSEYNLGDDQLFHKITKDCGHSEKKNIKCRREIKDLVDVSILPLSDDVDIKRTLDGEVTTYLWENLCHILPEALCDVAVAKPKNPIHYLAHKLLLHRHANTNTDIQKKILEAREYRANIFKERKEKAIKASKEWKSKQIKRRKPEESDDTQDKAVYNAYVAQQNFIKSLDTFYDPTN